MPYYNYFPITYQNPMNPYYQQNQTANSQNRVQQPQIQQSGFVLVQSEQEARAYPVAPGNSVTFKDERQPYCYVKTMGFNQLDAPIFERYRLVKEETPPDAPESPTNGAEVSEGKDTTYALKTDLDALWSAIDGIKEKMRETGDKKTAKKKIIEVETESDE